MPEKFPTPESNQEFNEAELALLKRLDVLEPNSPEMAAALRDWNLEQEALANQENTYQANFQKEIRKARLYRAAGLLKEAWETLDAAQTQARQENDRELFEQAGRLMDEVEAEADA